VAHLLSLRTVIFYPENLHRIYFGIAAASGSADQGASGGHSPDNHATEHRPILMGKKPCP
jgi:hypothetical protein